MPSLAPPAAIRPLSGAHPGQWDAWTDRRPGLPPLYSPDPAVREAALAASPDHTDPFRAALGLARDPGFERGLARMLSRPDWVRVCIALHDALVLAEFIRALRPARVLEIGTASGVSAAAILWALDAIGDEPSPRGHRGSGASPDVRLHSFDVSPHCYFDPARPSGSATDTMTPSLKDRLRVHVGDARHAAGSLAAEGPAFDLAFIDACHDHPWPTLDLLWIAPLLRPGAWVVLHDVAYARMLDQRRARENRPPKRSEYGPEALFESWPGAKVVGDGWAGNIGAIRIDDPAGLTPRLLHAALERPWEKQIPPEIAAIAGDVAPARH